MPCWMGTAVVSIGRTFGTNTPVVVLIREVGEGYREGQEGAGGYYQCEMGDGGDDDEDGDDGDDDDGDDLHHIHNSCPAERIVALYGGKRTSQRKGWVG